MSRTGAAVVAAWAAGNAALTVMLVLYGGPTLAWRSITFGSASVLVLLAGAALWFCRGEAPRLKEAPASSGGPALAAAAACLVGGLAWVFGVFLAYLAVPLMGYALGKWLAEDRSRGETP